LAERADGCPSGPVSADQFYVGRTRWSKIGETAIETGDWVVADDDGVIVVPGERAVEIANRALSVLERESREKSEIEGGRTLAEIAELQRWQQQKGDAPLQGFKPHGPEDEQG